MLEEINEKEINEEKIINQIRVLGIDMIHEANSGHPGIVLGAAPILYTLYANHLMVDKNHPNYFNRDRFILSAGHGSALLYATLYMAGFNITLEDLKSFRKIDSITPGHPEFKVTPGVEMTTGPLGQGIASAVGVAIGEKILEERYQNLVDFYTYVLCGDGDLMEGISYEASSLAGTLNLNKLIVLYDSNNICLDGKTSQTFNENIKERFLSQGWNYLLVEDGNNPKEISKKIEEAKGMKEKPTIIEIKTTIGMYSTLAGTSKVHGSPLNEEEISKIKEKLEIRDIPFAISKNLKEEFEYLLDKRCHNLKEKWEEKLETCEDSLKEEISFFENSNKQIDDKDLVYDPPIDNVESPRDTSSKILNSIVLKNPYLIGGAADLFGANKTYIQEGGDFSRDNPLGKNIFFGVREHAMGAILNGLSLVGFRPYGSTFLSFSDYLKPSMRLASLMNLQNIYIFSHDSISVGEDGPTHQPVEHLLMLRSLPNMEVFRPADANEVIGSYKAIFKKQEGPCAITLSRNKLPILEETKINEVEKGAYIALDTMRKPDGIILSSGEELHEVLKACKRLKEKGIELRVVSVPNLNRFLEQSDEYKEEILPVEIRKIVVEASSSYSWHQLIYNKKYLITLDEFGVSGNYQDIYKKYGFDSKSLEEKIENILK